MKTQPRGKPSFSHGVQHHAVQSSNIKSLGHHPGSDTLHVKFHNGGHYAYHGVDRSTFTTMMGAESKGGFLHKVIKPKYKHTKLA